LIVFVNVAIISLVGIVFFPNLRKFNTNQQFQNEVLDLKNLIKKAQANTTTGTRCSATEPALSWSVVISPGTNTISSTLNGSCLTTSQTTQVRTLSTITASNTSIQTSNCPSGNTIELKFDRTGFSYACNGGAFTQTTFSIQLQNQNTTSQSSTLMVNTAGTISQN
jgi:hypothetical protein